MRCAICHPPSAICHVLWSAHQRPPRCRARPPAARFETLRPQAFALLQLAQNEEATQWLRRVLAHNPEHPEANYELGKEFMSQGRSAEAIPYLEAAARLKPQFEPVHYQLQSAYRAAQYLHRLTRRLDRRALATRTGAAQRVAALRGPCVESLKADALCAPT